MSKKKVKVVDSGPETLLGCPKCGGDMKRKTHEQCKTKAVIGKHTFLFDHFFDRYQCKECESFFIGPDLAKVQIVG